MSDPQNNGARARWQPRLLGCAVLFSFIAATSAAGVYLPSPYERYGDIVRSGYYKLDVFSVPIVLCNYITFSSIFGLTVIAEWRLGIPVKWFIRYSLIVAAWCTQLAGVILWSGAAPQESVCALSENVHFWDSRETKLRGQVGSTLCDSWAAVFAFSILAFIALSFYIIFIPGIWSVILRILLPEHLRKSNSSASDAPGEEPLLPVYSADPFMYFEFRKLDRGIVSPDDSPAFDEEVEQQHSDILERSRKDGYAKLPAEDLENGEVNGQA